MRWHNGTTGDRCATGLSRIVFHPDPILATTEKPEHAAPHLQHVRRIGTDADIGRIGLSVLRIVNMPGPLVRLHWFHIEQNRHSERWSALLAGVRILVVDTCRLLPRDRAPQCVATVFNPDFRVTFFRRPLADWIRASDSGRKAKPGHEPRECQAGSTHPTISLMISTGWGGSHDLAEAKRSLPAHRSGSARNRLLSRKLVETLTPLPLAHIWAREGMQQADARTVLAAAPKLRHQLVMQHSALVVQR